jgi:hypothetical protein
MLTTNAGPSRRSQRDRPTLVNFAFAVTYASTWDRSALASAGAPLLIRALNQSRCSIRPNSFAFFAMIWL